jgi:hypothetical protein
MNSDGAAGDSRVRQLRRDYDRLAGEVRQLRDRGVVLPDGIEHHLALLEARLAYLEQPDSA